MSFLSVFKSIGHAFVAGTDLAYQAEPIIGILPGGAIAVTIINAIKAVEELFPAQGAGPIKKSVVTSVVTSNHPGVDPAALGTAIDEIVTAFNSIQAALAKVPATKP